MELESTVGKKEGKTDHLLTTRLKDISTQHNKQDDRHMLSKGKRI